MGWDPTITCSEPLSGRKIRPLNGRLVTPSVQGERPEAIDDAEARTVPGVVRIVPLPYGLGIIGETVEATRQAKSLLKIAWSSGAGRAQCLRHWLSQFNPSVSRGRMRNGRPSARRNCPRCFLCSTMTR